MKILLGLLIGGALGAYIGYRGQCATGTCPLTSNPYLGGIYGALIGALLTAPFAARNRGDSGTSDAGTAHSARIVDIGSEQAFDSIVLQAAKPVLVDLWAPWCGPCRIQAPTLDKLAEDVGNAAQIVKVNVDELPAIARRLGVQGIPTLVVFRGGKEAQRLVGLQDYETLKRALGV